MRRIIALLCSITIIFASVMTVFAGIPENGGIDFDSIKDEEDVQGETVATGNCGENVTWSLNSDGVLVISGSGDMQDFDSSSDVPWRSYQDSIKKIVITDEVTSAGKFAFGGLYKVEEVEFASAVTKICSYSFESCEALETVELPETLESIGYCAFSFTPNLKKIKIPASVKSIDNTAFSYGALEQIDVSDENTVYDEREDCNAIVETATDTLIIGSKYSFVPSGVKKVENRAFQGIRGYNSGTFPEGLEEISYYAFSGTGLNEVKLPESIKMIGNNAFSDTNITEIFIPAGVVNMYDNIATGCKSLEKISVSSSNKNLDSRNDCNAVICKNFWKEVQDDRNTVLVHFDGDGLIMGCKNTVIPADVKSVGRYAFYNLDMEEAFIPEGVAHIGEYAYAYNEKLRKVTIPKSVTKIDEYAFHKCGAITDIYYGGSKSDWNKINIQDRDKSKSMWFEGSFFDAEIHYNSDASYVEPDPEPDPGIKTGELVFTPEVIGKGKAFARFCLASSDGKVLRNQDYTLVYEDGSREAGTSDKTGYGLIEWSTDNDHESLNPLGKPKYKQIRAQVYLGHGSDLEGLEKLPYEVVMKITIKPLEFEQNWKGLFSTNSKASVGLDLEGEYLGFNLAAVEGGYGFNPCVEVSHKYENGRRILSMKTTGEANLVSGIKGPSVKFIGSINPYEVKDSYKSSFGISYGTTFENYDPGNSKEIGKLIFGTAAITSGNVYMLKAAEAMGFDGFNTGGFSNTYTVSEGKSILGGNVAGNVKGNAMSLTQDSAYTQTITENFRTRSQTVSHKKTAKLSGKIGTFVFKDGGEGLSGSQKADLIHGNVNCSEYAFSYVDSPASVSLTELMSYKSGGMFNDSQSSRETLTYTYKDGQADKLIDSQPLIRSLAYDSKNNIVLLLDSGLEDAIGLAKHSGSRASYNVMESEEKSSTLSLISMGLDAGIASYSVDCSLSGSESIGYCAASGENNGTDDLPGAENDIANEVGKYRLSLPELIAEPVVAVFNDAAGFLSKITGKIGEEIKSGYATIAGGVKKAGTGFVHIVRVMADNVSSRVGIMTYDDAYSESGLLSMSGSEIGSGSIFIGEATVVGEPYYVYVSSDAEGKNEIKEFKETPLSLTLAYSDKLLNEAGLDLSCEENIGIYEYSEELCGYKKLDSVNDTNNNTVTANIVKSGQYLLAVNVAASAPGVMTELAIGDTGFSVRYSSSVSYNGTKHIQVGAKQSKTKTADVRVMLYDKNDNLVDESRYKISFKNNKDSGVTGKKTYFTIKLKDKTDPSVKKAFKKTKCEFAIAPMDITGLKLTGGKLTDDAKGIKLKGLSYTSSSGKTVKLKQSVKAGKGDFEISKNGNDYIIKGVGNYTGTMTYTNSSNAK